MATQTKQRLGIARTYALIFGIAYVAVALLEDILGKKGWTVGGPAEAGVSLAGLTHAQEMHAMEMMHGTIILRVTAVQNVIHWAVGVAVLGSFFAGEVASKMVARIIGVVFVVVSLLGLFARTFTGKLFGFHAPLPWSYEFIHIVTAVFALIAGFAVARLYRAPQTTTAGAA